MLKAARVSVLILLLACSVRADHMQTGGSPESPPPSQPTSAIDEPANASQETSANGTMQNGAPGALTQVALEVLAALPSLF